MNKAMKYLTPKKPISKIARDRAEEMEERNVDLYEAIAGLFEELAALEQSNAFMPSSSRTASARSRSFPKPISFLSLSIWLLRKKLPTNEISGEAKTPG